MASYAGSAFEVVSTMAWQPDPVSARAPIDYTPERPWNEGANCVGGFTPSVSLLGESLRSRFPAIREVLGYSCRPNSNNLSSTSVHGLGRALDLMITPMPDGSADPRGNEIAQWLIDHAHEIGVQVIIWDRTIWSVSRTGTGAMTRYNGDNPHVNHIHVELNAAGAAGRTPWFDGRIVPVDDGPPVPQSPPSPIPSSELQWVGIVSGLLITATVGVGIYYGWRWYQRQSD